MSPRCRLLLAAGLIPAIGVGLLTRGALRHGAPGSTRGLSAVLAVSSDLGSSNPAARVAVNLGVAGRDQAGLHALVAAGKHIAPAEYARRFGPDPTQVEPLVARLRAAGLSASWQPGSGIVAVDGTARSVGQLLSVEFRDHVAPDGRSYYSADRDPALPGWLRSTVQSVIGLDNYAQMRGLAVPAGRGVGPEEMSPFYNFKALRGAGLDGTGETIALLDPAPSGLENDLNTYAQKHNLPPFDISIKGPRLPEDPVEVDLDLQVIHGMAPGAKLVVYAPQTFRFADVERVNEQMVADGIPVVSYSYGSCEAGALSAGLTNSFDQLVQRAAAQGQTWLVSSGDDGAYGCYAVDQAQTRIATSFPATSSWVTACGGTTVFLGQNNTYFKETVWGNAIRESGTGGGLSAAFQRPMWQKGPGVDNAQSNGMRQVPDVAGNADANTGWDVIYKGQATPIGGTSAAAPMWAALIAIINQDLVAKGMRRVGFANPAIYSFGSNPNLPGPPFHDVVEGNNLHFIASPGWDYSTGWGSPNGGALASAWEDYIKAGGA